MAVITRAYSEISDEIAYASSVNRVIDDIYTLQNGNINSANLAASGVKDGNIGDAQILLSHISYEAYIGIAEVF